jgi:NAD+ diphosphatase
VSGDPPVPVTLQVMRADGVVFLGLDADGHGAFATDLSGMEAEQAAELAGADRAVDVRMIAGTLSLAEAATAGYGRGSCGNDACGRLHFPKIEPAVIMTVQAGREPRRILLARHRGSSGRPALRVSGLRRDRREH